jgi:hypothetical protein
MKNNQIYFNVKDNKVKVSFKENLDLKEFLTLISTGILQTMNAIRAQTKQAAISAAKVNPDLDVDKAIQLCTEELYDMYNAAASHTLSLFAPDIEMRPHLTTQAIMEAEDRIIERMRKNAKDNKQTVSQLNNSKSKTK